MALTLLGFEGSASHPDGGTLPMQEMNAILWLLGMFLMGMSPLLLLPVFLTDAQGRRWMKGRTVLCIFGVGVLVTLSALVTISWHVVAPYAETALAGLYSLFNVAKELPGVLVDWFQSGRALYFFLKAFGTFAVIALFCARVLPVLQKGLISLIAKIKGNEVNSEPQSVNREALAASWASRQQDLQEKGHEKDELVRRQRLARALEQEQRLQRWGRGKGQYAR